MHLSRPPIATLQPFVERVWAGEAGPSDSPAVPRRELVLPTGSLHLVVRLADRPLRVFRDAGDRVGFTLGTAVVGGPRAAPYLKDISHPVPSVGALLRPGAAAFLAGAPAGEFAGAHTPLVDVWGRAAVDTLGNRLAEAPSLAGRLDLFEAALLARLDGLRRIDPLIAHAVTRLRFAVPVCEVAAECGLSHRHFTQRFRAAAGLKPKLWGRVVRFGRALDRLAAEPAIAWAELAAAEGYADQAHFTRDFRAFAGLSPGDYRRRAPANARHVTL
ncbi:AraC family transcriptional regulator [Pelagibius sp. 7325]|uniref:AraC family transcriptional regulator n=1 Tax=Pelagibius sp. 7325 TaxID=3131994 RepID=UPI0030ECBFED